MAGRSVTTTTMRVDRPDGTATEIVWRDLGRTTIAGFGSDGTPIRRYEVALRPDGRVIVCRGEGAGPTESIDPSSTTTRRNPYGSTLEEHDFDGVVTVVHGFDDEGRLRTISMEGAWGRQDLELDPDLGPSLTWACPLHRGEGSWNAWGTLDHYQVAYPDGSSYRWDLADDRGRETIIGWDGQTVVAEGVAPPTTGDGSVG
jgi:hypothetical protein